MSRPRALAFLIISYLRRGPAGVALGLMAVIHGWLGAADTLAPGQEGPLAIPGCSHNCVLYIPTDYQSSVPAPLVFFMHGSGGTPTTWPFRQATGGAGYIVCGLSYGGFPDAGANGIAHDATACGQMTEFIAKVRSQLTHTYNIDQRRVILAGLSMGGWAVNFYGFQPSQKGLYEGYCIIPAGAVPQDDDLTVAAGAPVLVVNGAQDPNLPQAKTGMPLLNKAGAIATQVVLPEQGHVPSDAAIVPPVKSWLTTLEQLRRSSQAMPAVTWTTATLAGQPEHAGDTKTILTHYVAAQPALSALLTDAPTLIFLVDTPDADSEAVSRKAADSTAVEEAVFSYPGASSVPTAAKHFTALRIDVSAITAEDNRFINQQIAPAVILLDKDHVFSAFFKGRSQLGESSLLSAMEKLLGSDDHKAVDAAIATVRPLVKQMKDLQRSMGRLNDQINELRAEGSTDPADVAHLKEQQKKLEDQQQTYQGVCDQLNGKTPEAPPEHADFPR